MSKLSIMVRLDCSSLNTVTLPSEVEMMNLEVSSKGENSIDWISFSRLRISQICKC